MFGVVVNYRLLATIATTSLSLLPVLTFMSRLGQEVPVEEKLLSELLDTHQQLDEVIEQQQEQQQELEAVHQLESELLNATLLRP